MRELPVDKGEASMRIAVVILGLMMFIQLFI